MYVPSDRERKERKETKKTLEDRKAGQIQGQGALDRRTVHLGYVLGLFQLVQTNKPPLGQLQVATCWPVEDSERAIIESIPGVF